jgi:4-hydroxybenzoate polyprenyltransferase
MLTGTFPPVAIMAAGGLWTAAMHAYSAIPDIDSDRTASVETIATVLGKTATLILCLVAFVGAAVLAFPYLGVLAIALFLIFATLIVLSLFSKSDERLFALYKYFPIVNACSGLVLFWFVAISKLL